MKLVNTHISKDCTRKVLVYVDNNGHYILKRLYLNLLVGMYHVETKGKSKFKHIESANRAVQKWLSTGKPL